MKKVILAARLILGAVFVVFGLNYYLKFLPMPAMDGFAAQFMGALAKSGFLQVVKIIEILGGALLISGRYAPLGLALLLPVIANIVLFDIFLAKAFNPAGVLVAALATFLLIVWRRNFCPIFGRPTA